MSFIAAAVVAGRVSRRNKGKKQIMSPNVQIIVFSPLDAVPHSHQVWDGPAVAPSHGHGRSVSRVAQTHRRSAWADPNDGVKPKNDCCGMM